MPDSCKGGREQFHREWSRLTIGMKLGVPLCFVLFALGRSKTCNGHTRFYLNGAIPNKTQ